MHVPRIEIRQLAHFVLACQSPTIAETARDLGIVPSALSVGLRTLESELQMKLFLRQGGHLNPLPSAFWLFQQATAVLHAESFARAAFTLPPEVLHRLDVRLDLTFSIGQFSKAISRTIESLHGRLPGWRVTFRFLDGEADPDHEVPGQPASPPDAVIDVGYTPGDGEAGVIPFHDDPWVCVSSAEGASMSATPAAPLAVVRMRPALIDAVTRHADASGLRHRLAFMDAEPGDLAGLLVKFPHTRFLLPASMVADRLGLVRLHVEPLVPSLVSGIGVHVTGHAADAANLFLQVLKDNLDGPEANVVFDPKLTAREIHYFNLAHQSGGISAAARVAHVTQPSVSSQIQKMEAVLGEPVFERRRSGVLGTPAGSRLLPLTAVVETHLDRIARTVRDVAARTQAAITIGMLPSSGHDSALTEKIAKALTTVRRLQPDCLLSVVEDSNTALHDLIRSGELNLAVVGVVQAQMARIHLGRSERLSVVANPALKLGGREDMPLDEACTLPMVLGTDHLTIHRAFVAAAQAQHLRPRVVMEAGSLPLAIAMVRQAPICTVLPMSSVQQDVRQGRLTATPITEDVISGNLSVIFSGERTLSEVERVIIQALLNVFAQDQQ